MEEKQEKVFGFSGFRPENAGVPGVWTYRGENPFRRGLIGGAIGMTGVLLIAALLYGGYTLYVHNQVLNQVVQVLNKITAQQQPAP